MARLRLLFALLLMNLGTWFAALAISGYYEPGVRMHSEPAAAPIGPSTSTDASQFISLLTRERFVAVETPVAAQPAKPKPTKTAAAKTKPPAVEKRPRQAAAQLPWPLSLLGN
jgi:hypothetical protein